MPTEVKPRRRGLKWAAVAVLLIAVLYAVDKDARLRAANEGHKVCPLIVALAPQHPNEIPTSAYGVRIVKGLTTAGRRFSCKLPTLPRSPR